MVSTRSHDESSTSKSTKRSPSPAPTPSSPSKKRKVTKGDEEEDGDQAATEGADSDKEDTKPSRKSRSPKKEHEEGVKRESTSPKKEEKSPSRKRTMDRKPAGTDGANSRPGEIPAGKEKISEEAAERKHGILETGHIYFLFRPRVEMEEAASIDDVSKFHIMLVPEKSTTHRLITVGKKMLPDKEGGGHARPIWGLVSNVGEDIKAFKESLGPYTYETKTLGTRHQPGNRVVGSGAYVIHAAEDYPETSKSDSVVYATKLVYALAVPHDLGEVQKAFHIHAEGSFTLQVKNPDGDHSNSVVRQQPEAKQPKMPAELKKLFNGLKWTPCDPPTFLDYPGTELLVIPSSHTPAQDIGEDAGKELEKEREDVEKAVKAEEGDDEAQKALKEVGLEGLMNGKGLEGHWE